MRKKVLPEGKCMFWSFQREEKDSAELNSVLANVVYLHSNTNSFSGFRPATVSDHAPVHRPRCEMRGFRLVWESLEWKYSRSFCSSCFVITLMGCCRNLTLAYINSLRLKLVSLYIILLRVAEPMDDIEDFL